MPSIAAVATARPGRVVSRNAAAAGPISNAVLRIAPIVRAHSATATAIAIR